MPITKLNLQNIRRISKKQIDFQESLNIIVGPNAIGKTIILESIFMLSLGKSFRAEQDREIISFGQDLGRIEGVLASGNEITKLELMLTNGTVMGVKTPYKKFLVNGVAKSMSDFTGRLKVVLFWPQDMELVTDSPSHRRRYLDFVLIQIDAEYRRTIVSYEKGIRQRNKILEAIRDGETSRHQLMFWDQLLIKNGEYISRKREEYINFINNFQTSGNTKMPKYQLFYDKSIISADRLEHYKEAELAAGVTLVGPHRDDMIFKIQNPNSKIQKNGEDFIDLSNFGSRGEQRLAILWLKLGELAFFENKCQDKPTLLLDDIFSELDRDYRQIIFNMIGDKQTIMTTTDLQLIDAKIINQVEPIELR
ncbi:DNA replication and repair protein RecF [Candidatus Gottesmanbacteria bacterium]|nr:DNA replication and repair protein RecF [Candidatus Gottesmanbacteria bacterium]